MRVASEEKPTAPLPRRLSRLFKVLVVGGTVLAAAYGTTLQGSTGAADNPDGGSDGGTQGW